MLPKPYRLVSKHDFDKVKRRGSVLTAPFFVLSWFVEGPDRAGRPRFGFVASKRLSKKSSRRNRAKRVLREAVRLFLKKEASRLSSADLKVVFILRNKILEASYEEVNYWVNRLLPKIFKL